MQDAVVEALFKAYFADGADIGDAAILAARAASAGLDGDEVAQMLASDVGAAEVLAEEMAARSAGVNGVPSFFLNGYALFSGALPAETIADGLRRAVAFLQERQAA